jgi:RsiW-degrading membrane proteinase PrsW (M82 family)
MLFATLALTVLPAAAALVWTLSRESSSPGRRTSLLAALVGGVVAVAVALLLGALLSPVGNLLSGEWAPWFHAFILGGVVEEGAKLLAIAAIAAVTARRTGPLSHSGLVHRGVLVGVAFSLIENTYFALGAPSILLLRTLTAVPLHIGTAAITASRFHALRTGKRTVPGDPLVISVLLHAAYDRIANLEGPLAYTAIAVPVATLVAAVLLYRAREDEPASDPL